LDELEDPRREHEAIGAICALGFGNGLIPVFTVADERKADSIRRETSWECLSVPQIRAEWGSQDMNLISTDCVLCALDVDL
jgi:hypothetical protein